MTAVMDATITSLEGWDLTGPEDAPQSLRQSRHRCLVIGRADDLLLIQALDDQVLSTCMEARGLSPAIRQRFSNYAIGLPGKKYGAGTAVDS